MSKLLVDKLFAVHDDPQYTGVWILAANHGMRYTGLTYTEELDALYELIKEIENRSQKQE
jgi:hypothetical protein